MPLSQHVARLLESPKTTRVAIVGASNNPRKYGQIILQDLLRKGFTVFPVNLYEEKVSGLPVHARVSALDDPIHIVNFVVPPEISLEILRDLDPKRFPVVWFQPGAFDRAVVDYAHQHFRDVLAGECIMVETR